MSKKILVTGVNGFVGEHLVRELKSRGYIVIGVGREPKPSDAIETLVDDYQACDLTSDDEVALLNLENVDAIINLAGLANVGASFEAAPLYKAVNVDVLAKLGNHLLKSGSSTRLVAISTGAVYDPDQPMPLTEASKLIRTGSPYAQSKIMMELAARELQASGLDCVIVRPFNHTGPGQAPGFLIPDLATKMMRFKESAEPIRVGNLRTKRDYTDVRDIVKGYADIATFKTLKFGLYNICSGVSHSGQEILDLVIHAADIQGEVVIEVDQSLIRPNDPIDLYGSSERLRKETGWKPHVPLETTVQDYLVN